MVHVKQSTEDFGGISGGGGVGRFHIGSVDNNYVEGDVSGHVNNYDSNVTVLVISYYFHIMMQRVIFLCHFIVHYNTSIILYIPYNNSDTKLLISMPAAGSVLSD